MGHVRSRSELAKPSATAMLMLFLKEHVQRSGVASEAPQECAVQEAGSQPSTLLKMIFLYISVAVVFVRIT